MYERRRPATGDAFLLKKVELIKIKCERLHQQNNVEGSSRLPLAFCVCIQSITSGTGVAGTDAPRILIRSREDPPLSIVRTQVRILFPVRTYIRLFYF